MKKIITILMCTLLFTGCTNSTFKKRMEEGKLAIVNSDYEKAEGMFNLALEEKNDSEATALLLQTKKLIEAIKLNEDRKFEETLNKCEEIENIESESDVVKKETIKLKDEVNEVIESINNKKNLINNEIGEIKDLILNKDYNDAKVKLEELSNEIEEDENLKEELNIVNNLMSTCDENIKKIEDEKKKQEEVKKVQQSNKISESKAISLVKNMLVEDNGFGPSIIEVDHIEGNSYVVHAYDIIINEEEGHTATWGWYYVDMNTGNIKSMFE